MKSTRTFGFLNPEDGTDSFRRNVGKKIATTRRVITQKSAVKIVINYNIIEQVTDFKYLGYCISEYNSDLEDKLQTYDT